jgi:Zn-dependent peptidase ImmA (M78 family)/DNA-binding XRE family transcriptional regulator
MSTRFEQADPRLLGNRLRAAREAKNKTQQEAADYLGVVRTTVVAIEKGERKLRSDELMRLAEFYGQDTHELLLPAEVFAPDPQLAGHFRRTARDDEGLEQEVLTAVNAIQRILRDYRELEQIYGATRPVRHAPDYRIPATSSTAGLALTPSSVQVAEEVAAAERQRLSLGEGPIQDLFDVVEAQEEGVSIFQMELPRTVSALFAEDRHLGPFIVINSHHDAGRRHWSLAHEYGHMLTHVQFPGVKITFSHSEQRVPASERFANAFAIAFLLPATTVGRDFNRIRESQGEFQAGDIMRLAHRYRVSFEAMALRLEDLRLIPPGTMERLKGRGYQPSQALMRQDLDPVQVSTRKLPLRYEYLVCMAHDKGYITEDQAMSYLSLDRLATRKRMRALSSQIFLSESGTPMTIKIPFAINETKGA